MTESDFRKAFPRASKSFLAVNPATNSDKTISRPIQSAAIGKLRGVLNATEREFAMILEAQKRNNEIASYEFEGITLRWSGLAYTPDFVVFPLAFAVSSQIKFVEVKGNYISGKFERAVERFRHAKTYYGDRFLFELHQKTKAEGWKRLL